MPPNVNTRKEMLAKFLGIDNILAIQDDVINCWFDAGKHGDYLVLTDEEATQRCVDYIKDSLQAFNSEFILDQCDLPMEMADMFKEFQFTKCESANDAILALIEKCCKGGVEGFAQAAIDADGRGHFLASYDGMEEAMIINKLGNESLFIYRVN